LFFKFVLSNSFKFIGVDEGLKGVSVNVCVTPACSSHGSDSCQDVKDVAVASDGNGNGGAGLVCLLIVGKYSGLMTARTDKFCGQTKCDPGRYVGLGWLAIIFSSSK